MSKTITGLDKRLAGIEMIGWPALEASLRAELAGVIEKARGMGMGDMTPTVASPKPAKAPRPRGLTCAACQQPTPWLGSVVLARKGRRLSLCPSCAKVDT